MCSICCVYVFLYVKLQALVLIVLVKLLGCELVKVFDFTVARNWISEVEGSFRG